MVILRNSPCVRKSPWLLFHRVLRRPATDVYPFASPLQRLARPRCFSATSPTSTAARRRPRAASNRSTNFPPRSRPASAARACPCYAFAAWEAAPVSRPSDLDLMGFQFNFISLEFSQLQTYNFLEVFLCVFLFFFFCFTFFVLLCFFASLFPSVPPPLGYLLVLRLRICKKTKSDNSILYSGFLIKANGIIKYFDLTLRGYSGNPA